jgi:glycosyltransferase involved in cell wall biosynthesis
VKDGQIVIARLWDRYVGRVPATAPVILGIDPQKYRTLCIYLTRRSGEPNFFEKNGCKTVYVGAAESLDFFRPGMAWRLSRVLRQEGVDILHCHKHKATVYGVIGAALARTPVVLSHVHGISRTRNTRRRIVNYLLFKRVNRILTVGEAVREDVLWANSSLPPDKVVSVGNSIDYNHFEDGSLTKSQARHMLGLPADSIVFGTVGRLARNKGQSHLIEAFAELKHAVPSAHLVLAGDGPLRRQLEQQAAQTFPDAIHLLGYRDDIPCVLKSMDVYVHPSTGSEGLPKSLLEAMAAGVPCIAANVGGVLEILGDNEFGVVIPPGETKAMREAMLSVARMADPDLQRLIHKAQSRVAAQYGHSRMIQTLESLYATEVELHCAGSGGRSGKVSGCPE